MLEKTLPIHMKALHAHLGGNTSKMGELMGISPSTINRAFAADETTRRQEDRALEIVTRLRQEEGKNQQPTEAVFLVRVSLDKTTLFTNLAAAAGFEAVAVQ
jgi:hypothetical protein